MKSISLVTYTNSVMKDVWPVYFGQLDKHFNIKKSFVFSDVDCSDYKNHTFLKYDNGDPYYKQYLGCLEDVSDDFIIYAQEDFFLYGDVNKHKLQEYVKFLKENEQYSFVRLIRCGYVEATRGQHDIDGHVIDDMYEVNVNSTDSFSMQPTIWRKDKLKKLYSHVQSEKWFEGENWFSSCRELDIRGVMIYNGEERCASDSLHYNSSIFPYTCTGICRGRWNLQHYKAFLGEMFEKYNIDPNDRGMRYSRTFYTK